MRHVSFFRSTRVSATVQAAIAAFVGAFGLPTFFMSVLESGTSVVFEGAWLALSLVCVAWIVATTVPLAQALARALRRFDLTPGSGERRRLRSAAGVAEILVAFGVVVLVQAVLRHPLARTLSAHFGASSVEATFAACILGLLLVLLVRLYAVGRPLTQGLAWRALDSVISTSGSQTAERSFHAAPATRTPVTVQATQVEPTLAEETVLVRS